jgi:hypothetical protein
MANFFGYPWPLRRSMFLLLDDPLTSYFYPLDWAPKEPRGDMMPTASPVNNRRLNVGLQNSSERTFMCKMEHNHIGHSLVNGLFQRLSAAKIIDRQKQTQEAQRTQHIG